MEIRKETAAFAVDEREERLRSKTKGSHSRFRRAQQTLAGGVSSGFRKLVRPYPLYFREGHGSRVTDVDGNTYLDYGLAWGPLILGHTPTEVVRALESQLRLGFTFGAQHDLEFEVAERMTQHIPCGDLVCFANSGTEIVQLALRLARAATGRAKHLKFEGHYHGWDDSVLVSVHPTREQIESANGKPIAIGTGQRAHADVIIAQWNQPATVERAFAENAGAIACVICEPVLCNSGCIPPDPGFLDFLRKITEQHGALLIFDEVITGFRIDLRGAQGIYAVTPDLATYAKAVGAGLALSALAGKAQFMDLVARGDVVHSGSLNGNPLSLTAAKVALDLLARSDVPVYEELWRKGERLRLGLEERLRSSAYNVVTAGSGPVFQVSFMEQPARTYRDMLAADKSLYGDFAVALLDEGVLVLPDGRWYISTAHSDEDIDSTLAAVERAASD